MEKVLIVSAKKSLSAPLVRPLGKAGLEVCAALPASLDSKISAQSPHCVLLVLQKVGEADWKPLVETVRRFDDNLPIIVLSASKDVDAIVRLMKMGVHDYMSWPPDFSKLQISIQNACRLYALTKRVFLLKNRLEGASRLDEMVGQSPPMQTLFQTIQSVAKTNATVLILGESGTGKELVAKAIHRLSPRNDRRFIDINCGAIPHELLENELFGHEKGSYTGADRRYIGCCERADGGTLFLDEISEMDPSLQVKLLRFLQEREFNRVGGTESIKVDVRIIAASNRNLAEQASRGEFREDLYYRLNVVTIQLPPLRERREDIPLLAHHFLEKYAHKNEKIFLDFTPDAMEALICHDWPGNIRELENAIERAVVLHNDSRIKLRYLPENLQKAKTGALSPAFFSGKSGADRVLPLNLVERYAIEAALKACTGNIATTAKRLKIGQATLYRKIKQYGIRT